MIPMHFGLFKLSFEDIDEAPRRLREITAETEEKTFPLAFSTGFRFPRSIHLTPIWS